MVNKDTNARQDKVFEIIVLSYIETAEPVGSRTISRLYEEGLSSASIRNVMADLEEEGFIQQPHTSAGRVPTQKGYRYYVDSLMQREALTKEEEDWILKELHKVKTIEGMAEKVSKVISELTHNAALIYIKNLKRLSFLNYLLEDLIQSERLIDFLEEEPGLFIEGTFRLFEQPEFEDAQKMRLFLQAFDEKCNFLPILLRDLEEEGVHVHIGRENALDKLVDVSLVVKDCYVGRTAIGGIAVVGPTRMRYSKIISVVEFVADTVSEAIERF